MKDEDKWPWMWSVKAENLEDLVEQLGNIPLSRVRLDPPPGLATEADVLEAERKHNRLCELVDGVLVEKGIGYRESLLAAALIEFLRRFVKPRKLGVGLRQPMAWFDSSRVSFGYPMSPSPHGIASRIAKFRTRQCPLWLLTWSSRC